MYVSDSYAVGLWVYGKVKREFSGTGTTCLGRGGISRVANRAL